MLQACLLNAHGLTMSAESNFYQQPDKALIQGINTSRTVWAVVCAEYSGGAATSRGAVNRRPLGRSDSKICFQLHDGGSRRFAGRVVQYKVRGGESVERSAGVFA